MKYLVLVLIVVAVIMVTRLLRPRGGKADAGAKGAPAQPTPIAGEAMLACAHCGVHLPRGEALPGRLGVYCSEAHRAVHEPRSDQERE